MKTIEEKARAYDEAIRKLRVMMPNWERLSYNGKTFLQDLIYIIPELAESEDEKVRKELIDAVQGLWDNDALPIPLSVKRKDEWLAWLEKQGTPAKLSEEEQNKFAKVVLRSCAMSFIDYLDAHKYEGKMCVSNGECEDIENAFHNAMWDRLHRYYCKYIEKQGEQKQDPCNNCKDVRLNCHNFPCTKKRAFKQGKSVLEAIIDEKVDNANKVEPKDYSSIDPHFGKSIDKTEPKFHEGEWITNGDYTWKIVEVKPLDYILQSQDGNVVDDTISHVDEQFHSFTIQDAKDGDVLAYGDNPNDCHVEVTMIFKSVRNEKSAFTHFHFFDDKFRVNDWCDCGKNAHPATKEQRELLFQKMKEAGYQWDAEKKEPKKIEQKTADKVEPKFHKGEWIVWKNKCYKVNYNGCGYELIDQNGLSTSLEYGTVDENAHLWDITKDAKDGDVLICKGNIKNSNGIKYERICLFNNLNNAFFTLTKTSNFVEEYDIDVNIDYPDNTVPATKEQKEILFMAMADAGYTFDFEKKKLKKIEPKTKENKGNIGGISANWSEEDECYMSECIGAIATKDGWSFEEKRKTKHWLKSLKDRVGCEANCTTTKEWSEEEIEKAAQEWDSKANFNPFYMTMDGDKPTGVKQDITTHKESFKAGVNWILKSLRPQSQWKPSKEQIVALRWVLNNVPYNKHKEEISGLLDQIKDL